MRCTIENCLQPGASKIYLLYCLRHGGWGDQKGIGVTIAICIGAYIGGGR